MNVALPIALRRYVDELVESGAYIDAAEVIRDAVRQMEARQVSRDASVQLESMTKAELDAWTLEMKNDLDSMSEMGEMESLRLQMAMDRMSRMMSTLSNLLKKISDTASSITQNLK